MFNFFKPAVEIGPFELLEFRKIRTDDCCDQRFEAWSRIYEYPLVLELIEQYKEATDQRIHNSSWGFEGCHILFKDSLEQRYEQVMNSDLLPSEIENTCIWDITKPPKAALLNHFDVVVNVSTVEEVRFDHMTIFRHLYDQVRPGGLLIITFDLPGLQIKKFEKLFGKKIVESENDLNGLNSALPNAKYKHLNCGFIVLRKSKVA